MTAEIITIGDEILIGQTIDTNSAWMAKQLNAVGIFVDRIVSISDEREAILNALAEGAERSELILITGGLGPTRDDITKETLCEFFDTRLVMNEAVREGIESWFQRRGIPVLDVNRKQAELPEAASVLPNPRGTAQGMWFERDGRIFVSMPGVPYEMKGIMEDHVIPRVSERFKDLHIEHFTIMTAGIGESLLADKVADWEDSLASVGVKIAYLPSPGVVKVRLTSSGPDAHRIRTVVREKAKEFEAIVGSYVFGYNDEALEAAVGRLLKAERKTIACAESCTGGRIAALLSKHPGSSSFFLGGLVCYSNEAKAKLLGVKTQTLSEHGAVSEETVREMAVNARERFQSDFAVASSGVAGPDGGSEDKPVGTVWIAVAGPNRTFAERFNFSSDRERNIERAVKNALIAVRNEILNNSLGDS